MMKLSIEGKDISLYLLRYVGVGQPAHPNLVFFQGIGDSQAVRGFKYILTRRQKAMLDLYAPPITWGSVAWLARGNWQMETKPHQVQGITMHLLTAYLPFGTWGGDDERYFFVTPGMPGMHHDCLLRQWANEHTPYPVPPEMSVMRLLDKAVSDYSGEYESEDPEVPVLVAKGRALGNSPTPWLLAVKPEALENTLKEVSYAS